MIFAVEGHIRMIRNGLYPIRLHPIHTKAIKTQTRRLNRGIYQIGKNYAVQRKRGVKAEPDIRIVMDRIWEEQIMPPFDIRNNPSYSILREEDAWAEGGYTPEEFEKLFREINPNWNGIIRYGFQFHVIEVQT